MIRDNIVNIKPARAFTVPLATVSTVPLAKKRVIFDQNNLNICMIRTEYDQNNLIKMSVTLILFSRNFLSVLITPHYVIL